ncbi:uncharacterized protein DMAD_12710 [Drosophila madeirensis]|uniref:Uncharacterized protein n=1 Tax=Drosophila madeirensis TaxID=30013 RepID=A0AAU9FHU1_DROMD
MTVLLREDNLYHVNIRELGTGFVVGCLLANDAAIEEAISLGLFEQILTFCVTDVRSTIKPKDGPFAIHFELMEKRENGGGFDKETAETEKVQKFATQVLGLNIGYVSLLFSLTNAIKMDKQTSDCSLRLPFGFPAHVNRDPGECFSSRLILIDNLASYSTRSCTDPDGRDNIGSSSSLFLRIVTGRADREEN